MFSRATQVPIITSEQISAIEALAPGIRFFHQIKPIETEEQAIEAGKDRLVPELFAGEIVSPTPHFLLKVEEDNVWLLMFETHRSEGAPKSERTESLGNCTKHP